MMSLNVNQILLIISLAKSKLYGPSGYMYVLHTFKAEIACISVS